MVGESDDLGQCTDNHDLAAAKRLAGVDLDSIKERTDDFDSLRASLHPPRLAAVLATFLR